MRRIALCLLPLLASACDNYHHPDPDAGIVDLAAPVEVEDLVPGPDLALVASGDKILAGHFVLVGVTTDDYLVYRDADTEEVFAMPLGGGASHSIAETADDVVVHERAVFAWQNVATNGVGDLIFWTAATGSNVTINGSFDGLASASEDGAWVFYSAASDDGEFADMVVAKADGTGAHVVAAQAALSDACYPYPGFPGGRLVFSHCGAPPDGGTSTATISVVDPATGTPTDLLTDAMNFWHSDRAGTNLLVANSAGAASVIPVAGGAGAAVDVDFASGYLARDGSAAIYMTRAGALKRASITPPTAPVTLIAAGVHDLLTLSEDSGYAIYDTDLNPVFPDVSDLFLTSTTTPNAPVTLSQPPIGALFGSTFTADGSRALYFTAVDENYVGAFNSMPVAGGTATAHAQTAWVAYASKGAQLVFNDHFEAQRAGDGLADLFVVDAAGSDPPALIANQANVEFFLSHAKDKVVYAFDASAGRAGIYVAPLP